MCARHHFGAVDAVFNVELVEDAGHVRLPLFELSQPSHARMPHEASAFHQ
jgi:hypothetical protein